MVDNQPKTTSDKQVMADVFGICHCYLNMTTSTKALPVPEVTPCKPETASRKKTYKSARRQKQTAKTTWKDADVIHET